MTKKTPTKANVFSINALKPRASDYEIAIVGHRGLVVRVHPSGARTFRFRYRQDGVLKRVALKATTLDDARDEWSNLRKEVKAGEDPAMVARKVRSQDSLKRKADRAALTVEQLVDEFILRYAKRKKKSWRADEVMLRSAVVSVLGDVLARDVQRRDVLSLVDKIATRAPVRANRVLAVVRKMFSWAVDQETVPTSPCTGIKPPGAETRRDRVLSDSELRALWNGIADKAAQDVAGAIKLQLLTGQRIGEVVGAQWREIDLTSKEWTIPGARSKNKRVNVVPLSTDATALLHSMARDGDFVFSRAGKKVKHLRVDVAGHELGVAAQALELEQFGSHDLRRTVATRLAEMRIPRVVIDSLLNHVDRTVGAVYDRHGYADEKRDALEAWSSKLMQIVSGKESSVTPIRRVENRSRRG